jgi:hypothetical protein
MGKPSQIDHILIDRGRHLSVLDVRSFRAADLDNDHYLVVAQVRKRLTMNEQDHRVLLVKFSDRKLNEVEGKEKGCV